MDTYARPSLSNRTRRQDNLVRERAGSEGLSLDLIYVKMGPEGER